MSQASVCPARRATSSNSPLSGPTNQRPSAASAMAARGPPTPGSTTDRKTVPAGNHAACAASRYAAALGFWTGASENSSNTGTPGAERLSTALTWPVYGPPKPKSVNSTIIEALAIRVTIRSRPCQAAAKAQRNGGRSMDRQEIEAALSLLLDQMEGGQGDSH